MRIVQEEIFGPVVAISAFDGEEEAIELANDSRYGLSGSIWTRDIGRALRVARAVETGMLSINSSSSVHIEAPFGGVKASGYRPGAGDGRPRALLRVQVRLHRQRLTEWSYRFWRGDVRPQADIAAPETRGLKSIVGVRTLSAWEWKRRSAAWQSVSMGWSGEGKCWSSESVVTSCITGSTRGCWFVCRQR